ncbi:MAG TPA: hypothetical protein VF444_23450 [Pseudonocardiaceae bacterium]
MKRLWWLIALVLLVVLIAHHHSAASSPSPATSTRTSTSTPAHSGGSHFFYAKCDAAGRLVSVTPDNPENRKYATATCKATGGDQ